MEKTINLKIKGMHCVSCAMNIDIELEDTQGIIEARTDYAKQQTLVTFDSERINLEAIKAIVERTGYQVSK